jgi:hypothetical protein
MSFKKVLLNLVLLLFAQSGHTDFEAWFLQIGILSMYKCMYMHRHFKGSYKKIDSLYLSKGLTYIHTYKDICHTFCGLRPGP